MTLRERIERIVASQLMILATNVEWEGFWSSFMFILHVSRLVGKGLHVI